MAAKTHRLMALVFAVMLITVSLVSCEKKVEPDPPQVSRPTVFINLLPVPEHPVESVVPIDNGFSEKAKEKYKQNEDSIGWLNLPNTSIDDVVMLYPDKSDKFYYLRRNFEKRYSFDGTYFADYRSKFGGGRAGISKNTIIYGHSMSDDPTTPLFSQLKKYWQQDYATDNPYIFFSDMEEDMAWEIFAVFVTNTGFKYHKPDPEEPVYMDIIQESRERSMYNYDLTITPEDKIITLSTCLYTIEGVYYGYPNNYRYVVMAKLVPLGEKLKDKAALTINPSPLGASVKK